MMKYKVGDRVRIVNKPTGNFNDNGRMDCWCGKTVTISKAWSSSTRYKIEEDQGDDFRSQGWSWKSSDFVGLVNTYIPISLLETKLSELIDVEGALDADDLDRLIKEFKGGT